MSTSHAPHPASPRLFDRRTALGGAALALGALACHALPSRRRFDGLVRGARVVDGGGGAPFVADVAIEGDRVAQIGSIDPALAGWVLEAQGLCLAPGFVDIHTHSDRTIFEWPGAESRVLQGCTSEITGNCGGSAAPTDGADDHGAAKWSDVRSYIAANSASSRPGAGLAWSEAAHGSIDSGTQVDQLPRGLRLRLPAAPHRRTAAT